MSLNKRIRRVAGAAATGQREGSRRRGRERSAAGKRRWTIVLVVAGAAAATAAMVVASLSRRPWRFDDYVVTGNRYLTAEEVVAASNIPYGANLFTADLKAAENNMIRNPRIRSAKLTRRVPGKLVVKVEERPACAAVIVNDQLFKVAPDGVILEELSGHYEDLPILTGVAFSVRGPVSGRVIKRRDVGLGLEVIRTMAAVDGAWAAEIDAVDVKARKVTLAAGTRHVRYDADFDENVARRLRLVYGAVGAPPAVLTFDVRFKNDVVVRGLATEPATDDGGKDHGGPI